MALTARAARTTQVVDVHRRRSSALDRMRGAGETDDDSADDLTQVDERVDQHDHEQRGVEYDGDHLRGSHGGAGGGDDVTTPMVDQQAVDKLLSEVQLLRCKMVATRALNQMKLYTFLGLSTAAMTLMETTSPTLIGVSLLSIFTVVGAALVRHRLWVTLLILTVVLGTLIVGMAVSVHMIEQMDQADHEYDIAWQSLINEAEESMGPGAAARVLQSLPHTHSLYPSDQLRQPPLLAITGNRGGDGASDGEGKANTELVYFATLLTHAATLQHPFRSWVVLPVSNAAGGIVREPPPRGVPCPVHATTASHPHHTAVHHKECTCRYSRPPPRMGIKGVWHTRS